MTMQLTRNLPTLVSRTASLIHVQELICFQVYASVLIPSSGAPGSAQATTSPSPNKSSGIRIGAPVASIIFVGILAGLFSI
jgi:hypothetical protein